MTHETQRKFLVNDLWRPDRARSIRCREGYLSADPDRLVRVVTSGEQATLTVTRVTPGRACTVFEYDIPLGEANLMLDSLCLAPVLEKERYREVFGGRVWTVDDYAAENRGLRLAGIELATTASFTRPAWLDAEVTGDPRYFSSNLWRQPFTRWSGDRRLTSGPPHGTREPATAPRP